MYSLLLYIYSLTNLYISFFFFFNDTATTEIYTLSLHDALPISGVFRFPIRYPLVMSLPEIAARLHNIAPFHVMELAKIDRKSTRLNSSHANISYAVFCLKKKKKKKG